MHKRGTEITRCTILLRF